jgi:hypothetical protein
MMRDDDNTKLMKDGAYRLPIQSVGTTVSLSKIIIMSRGRDDGGGGATGGPRSTDKKMLPIADTKVSYIISFAHHVSGTRHTRYGTYPCSYEIPVCVSPCGTVYSSTPRPFYIPTGYIPYHLTTVPICTVCTGICATCSPPRHQGHQGHPPKSLGISHHYQSTLYQLLLVHRTRYQAITPNISSPHHPQGRQEGNAFVP